MTVIPNRFVPLTEFVSRNAEWYPGKTAIICEGQRLTWKDFNWRANRIANHLIRLGISKGEKVAILSQNCLEYPEITFGILKAGAAVVPLSTMLKKETILLEMKDAGPKAVFAGNAFFQLIGDFQPISRRIVLERDAQGWTSYQDFLQAGSEEEPETVVAPEDFYNVIYSSGTTGRPKGIVHTHQARLRFAMTCGLEFRVHNDAISLVSTPLYSNGTQLVYLPTLLSGGTLVLTRSFEPGAFLDLVEEEKCTHAFLVPTQFIRILEHPEFSRFDTSSIEILLSAAAPLSRKTKSEILSSFPKSKLVELYGVTEGISTVLRPNEQLIKPGSVGKPRLGGDVKIIDGEGRELPRGEAGEIVGFNFSMMGEYYQNPDATREAVWHDRRGRVYIKTGDIGKLDEDGYLYLHDRKKDLIISGGINIYPSDIEEVLQRHPEIAESAVIGVPHREWGESPLALVVKKNLGSHLTKDELRDWANSHLAYYQRLVAVEYRQSLPKNDMGKVLKSELRQPYWEDFEK